jgi:thiol:disulfide interchange protein
MRESAPDRRFPAEVESQLPVQRRGAIMQAVLMPLIQTVVAIILLVILAWIVDRYVPAEGKTRTVLGLVFTLIAVGIGLWLVNTYIPMAESIKAILNILVFVATCVYVLKATGAWIFIERTWNSMMERAHSPSGNPFSGPLPPRSESAPPPHPTRP